MELRNRLIVAAMLCGLTAGLPGTFYGQTNVPVDRAAITTTSQSLDLVLSRFEAQFVTAADAMPSEQYNFSPDSFGAPRADFKGVRSFAAEVKHVAEMNYVIYNVMSGLKPDIDMNSIKTLKTKSEIMSALTHSFAYGHRAIATLNATDANEMPADSHGMTRLGIAAYIMLHDADHYGQMVEYLRMNGIVPPASRQK